MREIGVGIMVYVIIPAAGEGQRMKSAVRKQYLDLLGRPMLVWTVELFHRHPEVAGIVLAVPAGEEQNTYALLEKHGVAGKAHLVAGGADRRASVRAALLALPPEATVVLVHDAVRPLVERSVIEAVMEKARHGAVCAALPAQETVKICREGKVVATPDRSSLWHVQTPQGFPRRLLERAHEAWDGRTVTDDCQLVEMLGEEVSVVRGNPENIKITTPVDLLVARALLSARQECANLPWQPESQPAPPPPSPPPSCPGMGVGYDVHRLVPERRLVLGGVQIPYERGLAGHSDADVLLHAVIDALLGAAGLGDIGRHFPDTEAKYKGISSLELLRETVDIIRRRGLMGRGVDATIIAERPRLASYIPEMRQNIATIVGLPPEAVNIKATTNEKMGFLGRGEGIAALSVATVSPAPVKE